MVVVCVDDDDDDEFHQIQFDAEKVMNHYDDDDVT